MSTPPAIPSTNAISFLDQPRELRDIEYTQALSTDGRTVQFTLVTDKDGKPKLRGPDAISLLLSCSQVYREMKETMHELLTIQIANDDVPERLILRQLQAQPAQKMSISRLTVLGLTDGSHAAYNTAQDRNSLPTRIHSDIVSGMVLLNMRFPHLRKLDIGFDLLEWIHIQPRGSYIPGIDNNDVRSRRDWDVPCGTWDVLGNAFNTLRSHPNIEGMQVRIVWKTFLDERKVAGGYGSDPAYTKEVREKLRERALEVVRGIIPTAVVTGCVEEEM
jgi:hypothetical protein